MVKEQADQKPALATAPEGEEFIKRIVDRVAIYLQEMMDGKLVAAIPDYYP
jgi:hypothetical protein